MTSFNRVLKFAVTDFLRNMLRSTSAIFVLVMVILLATGLFFMHGISSYVIVQVQNKIDITAYFKSDAAEDDILSAKDQLVKADPAIKNIQYVSKDAALENFKKLHADNPVFANALMQVGDNPFLPSLNITTNGDPAEYQKIADILQQEKFNSLIDKVDFLQKKDTINKVFSITSALNTFGITLAIILMLIAALIVFNTIKLAIDSAKDQIQTQRIVGATAWFVQAPFIIQGALFGAISFIICFILTFAFSYLLSPKLIIILSGFSLWSFFMSNLFLILLIQLGIGVGLGAVTSYLVVQKYLKV